MVVYPAIQNEGEIIAKFNNFLTLDVVETTNRFARMDGIGTTCVVEIKTRTNKYDQYPTTILPRDKVEHWRNNHPDKDFYCIFRFTDGDYYYKWEEDDPNVVADGGRTDREKIEIKPYCYIPINQLTKF